MAKSELPWFLRGGEFEANGGDFAEGPQLAGCGCCQVMRCGKMMSGNTRLPLGPAAWYCISASKVSCFLSRAMRCYDVSDKQQDQIDGDDDHICK